MKKTVMKSLTVALCVSIFSATTPAIPMAFAEETAPAATASTDIRARTQAILHPETTAAPTVKKIPEGHAYIPKDTILEVKLTEAISSKKMKKGNIVPLVLCDNLLINDTVVVPAGTTVNGIVTDAKSNGRFGRSGKLEFNITSVKTINHVDIPLEYVARKEAGSDGGAVAVAAVVSLVGGFFMKGKNVEFPANTIFEAKVTSDTDLNCTLTDLPDAMNPQAPHGVNIVLK